MIEFNPLPVNSALKPIINSVFLTLKLCGGQLAGTPRHAISRPKHTVDNGLDRKNLSNNISDNERINRWLS